MKKSDQEMLDWFNNPNPFSMHCSKHGELAELPCFYCFLGSLTEEEKREYLDNRRDKFVKELDEKWDKMRNE